MQRVQFPRWTKHHIVIERRIGPPVTLTKLGVNVFARADVADIANARMAMVSTVKLPNTNRFMFSSDCENQVIISGRRQDSAHLKDQRLSNIELFVFKCLYSRDAPHKAEKKEMKCIDREENCTHPAAARRLAWGARPLPGKPPAAQSN